MFGISKQIPNDTLLNYIGVNYISVSCIVLLFVEVEEQKNVNKKDEKPVVEVFFESTDISLLNGEKKNEDIFDRMGQTQKRILGTVLCFFSGIMFGLAYMPNLWC